MGVPVSGQATIPETPADELHVGGAVSTPPTLTVTDLKSALRRTITVFKLHSQKTDTYEGGLLEEILRTTGTLNSEHLRGPVMEFYVIAEATDGNRVVFSLAGLDSGIIGSNIFVADTMDGAPLSEREGLIKIVVSPEIKSSALDSHAEIQHRRSCAIAVPSPLIRIRRDSL